jgi:uncharacterized protein YjbI with pentapeptide repeats
MIGKESCCGEATKVIGEVAVFCTLSLLGGGLFVLVALTNITWFYPTLFFGVVLYVAAQRYFYFGPRADLLDSDEHRAQEEALRAYLDQMANLIVDQKLLHEKEESEVRSLARARTLTILHRLAGERKGSVVRFLYEAGLINKDLPILNLKGASLDTADLHEITLLDVRLKEADLRLADLTGANLTGSDLTWADLRGADLSSAVLTDVSLAHANLLPYDHLKPALLNAPHLLNGADPSDLTHTRFDGADLTPTRLDGANLQGADLSGAFLYMADLTGANLVGANLARANLAEADLTGADLRRARYDAETLWPEDFIPEEAVEDY